MAAGCGGRRRAKEPVSFAEGELRGIERGRPTKVVSLRGTDGSNPSPSSGESIANSTSSERGDARARRGCQSVSNPTQSSYLATLGRRPAAELGIIAEAAGHEIARRAHVKYLDLSAVRAGLASIGAITGVRSTPTPAAALRRAARRHLRGVSQKGVM